MENKKSYNAESYLPTEKVYGCARIVPPEEREKLRKNKQTNI